MKLTITSEGDPITEEAMGELLGKIELFLAAEFNPFVHIDGTYNGDKIKLSSDKDHPRPLWRLERARKETELTYGQWVSARRAVEPDEGCNDPNCLACSLRAALAAAHADVESQNSEDAEFGTVEYEQYLAGLTPTDPLLLYKEWVESKRKEATAKVWHTGNEDMDQRFEEFALYTAKNPKMKSTYADFVTRHMCETLAEFEPMYHKYRVTSTDNVQTYGEFVSRGTWLTI